MSGRTFAETDTDRAPGVAIVGDRLARRLWPGRDPIGQRIMAPGGVLRPDGTMNWATVVGVVEDARYRGLADPRFDLYLAHP